MRKLAGFIILSLDGLFEGVGGSLDWHRVDAEFREFAIKQLQDADVLLFGRKTYEMMAAYWPDPEVIRMDPGIASLMNARPKVVFSHTLKVASWANTRIEKEFSAAETGRMSEGRGELLVVGSAGLIGSLLERGWLDELRIMVVPVLLGEGSRFFSDFENEYPMQLLRARVFGNGNVLLTYRPSRARKGMGGKPPR